MTEKLYNSVTENIDLIKKRVEVAAEKVGRNPKEIKIMAVTKTVAPELINLAIENDITLLGENRAQEMNSKILEYNLEKAEIHFIGALQSNKVRQIIDHVTMIQSVDRASLIKEIEKQAALREIVMDILVEVNIGKEATKAGIMPENVLEFVDEVEKCPHIRLRGLMAIPPIYDISQKADKHFAAMRQLFVDIKQQNNDNVSIDTLSMGMSGDFESAIWHGSTLVRIGTALFGERHN